MTVRKKGKENKFRCQGILDGLALRHDLELSPLSSFNSASSSLSPTQSIIPMIDDPFDIVFALLSSVQDHCQ